MVYPRELKKAMGKYKSKTYAFKCESDFAEKLDTLIAISEETVSEFLRGCVIAGYKSYLIKIGKIPPK